MLEPAPEGWNPPWKSGEQSGSVDQVAAKPYTT